MQKVYVVQLSSEEREQLQKLVKKGSSKQGQRPSALKLTRARILLKADQAEGASAYTDAEIAEALEVSPKTVFNIRKKWVKLGLEEALERRPQQNRCQPGDPLRIDSEYVRLGTCNLCMFCEPLRGWRHVRVTDRRTKVDWAYALRDFLMEFYSEAEKIVLVMDNLNTHSPRSFYEAFEPQIARELTERLEIHYTPKHGSWLNIAECEFSVLQRQCLDRRIEIAELLGREVNAWQESRNAIDQQDQLAIHDRRSSDEIASSLPGISPAR